MDETLTGVAVLEALPRQAEGSSTVAAPEARPEARYELFHDLLAEPILDWRRGYGRTRPGARRTEFARIGGVLVALVAVFAALGAWALISGASQARHEVCDVARTRWPHETRSEDRTFLFSSGSRHTGRARVQKQQAQW
jgi:hypothetical protein